MKERTLSQLPPLNALRAFEASARLLSFKDAAEELCVTPAAVSHQIRQLEEILGVALFTRTKSGVQLSEEGELLYPNIRKGFEYFMEAILSLDKEKVRNFIRVTAGPAFVAKWLVPSLHNFTKSNDDIEIDIVASLSNVDFKTVPMDLAVRFGNLPANDLFSEKVVEEQMVPMISPSLLTDNKLEKPSDLREFELIHDKSLSLISDDTPDWSKWFDKVGIKDDTHNRGIYFNQADHAIQAAVSGSGVLLGRLVLALRDILEGRLIVPFGPVIPSGLYFYFVHEHEQRDAVTVNSLKKWISESIENDLKELRLKESF